jgi:hypothetical protein
MSAASPDVGSMTKEELDAYLRDLRGTPGTEKMRIRQLWRNAQSAKLSPNVFAAKEAEAAAERERVFLEKERVAIAVENAARNAMVNESARAVIAARNARRGNTSRNTMNNARRRAAAQHNQMNNNNNLYGEALGNVSTGFEGYSAMTSALNPNSRKNRKSRKIRRNRS